MKQHIFMLSLLLTFMAASCSKAIPGSYTSASTTGKEVVDAAEFAVMAEEHVLKQEDPTVGVTLELIAILDAKQQVVAGMNYQLLLTVKANGKNRKAEVVVWWQEWRKPEPYILKSWKWQD